MRDAPGQRTYRLIVFSIIAVSVAALALVAVALIVTRPPSARQAAATLSAAAQSRHTPTPQPTPVPTLAGVRPELLLCQRQAGQAMYARRMVGAVNLADDQRITFQWVARGWTISNLDSALAGVMSSLDVALEVWQEGCAVYDRVEIIVHDREGERQVHRFTVRARMEDVLRWRTGELDDAALIGRLEVEPAYLGDEES